VRETEDFEMCVLACDSRYDFIGWMVSLRWLVTIGLFYWLDGKSALASDDRVFYWLDGKSSLASDDRFILLAGW
jgi:hypothetical protein